MRNLKKMALSENTKVVLTLTNTGLIIIAIIGFIWGIATFTGHMRQDIYVNSISIKDNASDICEIQTVNTEQSTDIHELELQEVEIKTKLINIESRLLEVLTILKEK